VLRRFAEYHELEGAFGRRALTERAKGILMERHAIDEARAFELLREHSRASNRKLIDLATAVVDGHRLLPKATAGSFPALTRSRARRGRRIASSRSAPPSHWATAISRRMATAPRDGVPPASARGAAARGRRGRLRPTTCPTAVRSPTPRC
jgi:hypothetical protein